MILFFTVSTTSLLHPFRIFESVFPIFHFVYLHRYPGKKFMVYLFPVFPLTVGLGAAIPVSVDLGGVFCVPRSPRDPRIRPEVVRGHPRSAPPLGRQARGRLPTRLGHGPASHGHGWRPGWHRRPCLVSRDAWLTLCWLLGWRWPGEGTGQMVRAWARSGDF